MSDERPLPLGWRLAVLLATVAALALFAWVAAQQFWRWSAPRQAAGLPAAPADPAAAIVASGLWSGTGAPLRTGGEPATGEIRLLGILAERDGRGIAVFRTRDGARAVAVGAEVVPGTSLLSVEPRSVRLREGAAERTPLWRSAPYRSASYRPDGVRASDWNPRWRLSEPARLPQVREPPVPRGVPGGTPFHTPGSLPPGDPVGTTPPRGQDGDGLPTRTGRDNRFSPWCNRTRVLHHSVPGPIIAD